MNCDLCQQEQPTEGGEVFGPFAFCGVCISREIARSNVEWELVLGHAPYWPLSEEAAARVLAGRWFHYSVTTDERAQQAEDDQLFAADHSWASDNRDIAGPRLDDDFATFRSEE